MINDILKQLDIYPDNPGVSTGKTFWQGGGRSIQSFSPVDGLPIAQIGSADVDDYNTLIEKAEQAFIFWRSVPAPKRGEIVRKIGEVLRLKKDPLGQLVSYEMGKSIQEGLGEVQEMIDICDYAVGLSRQLYGLTMHSERPLHRMYEQYHPLGLVGIISAFNFPVAVWSWNAMLAWVCGDVCIWKPSEKTPLSALACQKIVSEVFSHHHIPDGVSNLIIGDARVGEWLSQDHRVPLISATGSTKMGRAVAIAVANRLGKSLLELGGNNAIIVSEQVSFDLLIPSVVFGAVGTAGQRCTTTRRLIVHESIIDVVKQKLITAYKQLKVGNPLDSGIHVGPLIDQSAVHQFLSSIETAQHQGGKLLIGGNVLSGNEYTSGCYVNPAIIEMPVQTSIVQQETFAPILYIMSYKDLKDAIALHNAVPQGLSSSLFTNHISEAEYFLSVNGSDCGIANINIGTSGAEIGGAFGGEKETGGGRESGSDAWKIYMRRQTNTINYGSKLPLAQGIRFDL